MLRSHEEFTEMLDALKRDVIPGDEQIADFKETLEELYKVLSHAEALIAFAEMTALLARSGGHNLDGLANLALLYANSTKKVVTQIAIAENRSKGKLKP